MGFPNCLDAWTPASFQLPMKSFHLLPFALGALLFIDRCPGDVVALSSPLEVQLTYEGGFKVALKRKEFRSLEALVLTEGDKAYQVPPEEMADIFNPILSEVLLTRSDKICVIIEFDYRPYAWGDAAKTANFYFVDGKYSHRWVTIPTGKDTFTLMEKKAGEAETPFGEGGALPAAK